MSRDNEPQYPEVGVLALVPDVWPSPPMARHQILTRLSSYYHVAWAEPPQEWREIWLEGNLRNGDQRPELASLPGFHRVVPGRWLPKVYRPAWLGSLLDRQRVRRAAGVLRKQGCSRLVLYIWRPRFVYALDVESDLALYHVDDDYSFSEEEVPITSAERRLLTESDAVFLHSPALWDRLSHFNPRTVYLPNGVDFAAFSKETAEPRDLASVPRPRVGYVGIVKKQLDLSLLEEIAARRQDWSVVLVGPRGNIRGKEDRLERLEARTNVHFLGPKSPEETAAYMQHMDVCTLPYEVDDYTKYINPLKMYEYLAAGRPVVGAALPAIEEFSQVVSVASSVDEWMEALETAMSPGATSDDRVVRRQSVARHHDWSVLTRRVAETIAEGLDLAVPAGAP